MGELNGEKARLEEARGHVCTLLCKAWPFNICKHASRRDEWRDGGEAQWQHRRRTYPSYYSIVSLNGLVMSSNGAL